MNKDFILGQSNEIISDHKVYDLHNFYDYSGCMLKSDQIFWLFFAPNPIYGPGQIPIAIEFVKVDFLRFSSGFGTSVVSSLEEMGYKSSSDFDDYWLLREDQASTSDHLFFRFASDAYIRVHSVQARIHKNMKLL